MIYKFTIPLAPQGKARGRAVRMGGKVRVVTPQKTRTYEGTIADLARAAVGELVLDGPIGLKVWAVFPRTKEMAKVYKKTGRPKHSPAWLWAHKQRIDIDNIVKSIMDGLTQAGVWLDDRQVSRVEAFKVHAEMVETSNGWRQVAPHCVVQIFEYSTPVQYYKPPSWVTSEPANRSTGKIKITNVGVSPHPAWLDNDTPYSD